MAPPTTTSVNGKKINEVPNVISYKIINILRCNLASRVSYDKKE